MTMPEMADRIEGLALLYEQRAGGLRNAVWAMRRGLALPEAVVTEIRSMVEELEQSAKWARRELLEKANG